jgi:hypothetical protein
MYPANAYHIRRATEADDSALRDLAELDGRPALSGPALVGEIDGAPAAAVSLIDGRVIADPFKPTAVLTQILRMRFNSMRSHARTPSVTARIGAALAPFRTHASEA